MIHDTTEVWKRPLDSDVARFYFLEIIGMVKGFHVTSPVCCIVSDLDEG
jgi:hypothetical protein